jgi:hypothetical protein
MGGPAEYCERRSPYNVRCYFRASCILTRLKTIKKSLKATSKGVAARHDARICSPMIPPRARFDS